jgi:hypothetical protein
MPKQFGYRSTGKISQHVVHRRAGGRQAHDRTQRGPETRQQKKIISSDGAPKPNQ